MKRVTSFEEVQSLVSEIRGLKMGFVTNFFPDPFKVSLWCKHDSFFHVCYGNTIFFLRKRSRLVNLYYCATGEGVLKDNLSTFLKEHDQPFLVVDIVGGDSVLSCKQLFVDKGFEEHTTLVRMSRVGGPSVHERVPGVVSEATDQDISSILDLYHQYFDPYSEQIPLQEELFQWVSSKSILVSRVGEKVVGFLIYELIGVTLYLRYWFVHPDYRDCKIGASLFREFFYRGKMTKRQLFWVITSNENAIKRYMHYGFSQERMFDHVLIRK